MLTKREALIFNMLQKHLDDQVKHNAVIDELPPQEDPKSGEIIDKGLSAMSVDNSFGDYFTESFQNSLKTSKRYLKVSKSNRGIKEEFNVTKFVASTTRQSKYPDPVTGEFNDWVAPARVILAPVKYIGKLEIPEELRETVEVDM